MKNVSPDELLKLAKSYEDEIEREKMQLRMTEYIYSLILRQISKSKPVKSGNE